jgi:hypothetical protein
MSQEFPDIQELNVSSLLKQSPLPAPSYCSNTNSGILIARDCSFFDNVWTYKATTTLSQQFKSKYVIDVDGHSFSGRFRAFLWSKSLPIKSTIFREWHDSRLMAWFVPSFLPIGAITNSPNLVGVILFHSTTASMISTVF